LLGDEMYMWSTSAEKVQIEETEEGSQ